MGISQTPLYDKALSGVLEGGRVPRVRSDNQSEGVFMKILIAFLLAVMMALPTWANEKESSAGSESSSQSSGDAPLRVQDLPKSVQHALAEIQRLSAKVEPEIEKFGSRFRQEVDQAVKKLKEAVKSQRSPATKETP